MIDRFNPERLATLAAVAMLINGDRAPEPMPGPIVVNDDGRALVPVPSADLQRWMDVDLGILLQWAHAPELGGALLSLWGGPPDERIPRNGLVAAISPRGLRGLADELRAIADKVEAQGT